jgi:hypothetical protein
MECRGLRTFLYLERRRRDGGKVPNPHLNPRSYFLGRFENSLGTLESVESEEVTKNRRDKLKHVLIKKCRQISPYIHKKILQFILRKVIYEEMFSDKNKEVISHT